MPNSRLLLAPGTTLSFAGTGLARTLYFVFGDGFNGTPSSGSTLSLPIPMALTVLRWKVRLDVSGSATFAVEYASTLTGAVSGVGGTQPSVTSALGNSGTVNWTTTSLASGGVLKVTLSSVTTAQQVTLAIEAQE